MTDSENPIRQVAEDLQVEGALERMMLMVYISGFRRGQLNPSMDPDTDPRFGKKLHHWFARDIDRLEMVLNKTLAAMQNSEE